MIAPNTKYLLALEAKPDQAATSESKFESVTEPESEFEFECWAAMLAGFMPVSLRVKV
jgi:hypothetical protein